MRFCESGQEEVNGVAITVNIYYSGVNGNARKFTEEMVSSGIVNTCLSHDGKDY